jgi:hypothetical protein
MRKVAQNRDTRIVHRYPEEKKLKDRIYYCRSRQEVLDLFDNMIITFGESLTLKSLVDVNDDNNPEWIDQETKTKNKNKPQLVF